MVQAIERKIHHLARTHADEYCQMVDDALSQIERADMQFNLLSIHDARCRNFRLFRGEEGSGRVALDIAFRHCELEQASQVPPQMSHDASRKVRGL